MIFWMQVSKLNSKTKVNERYILMVWNKGTQISDYPIPKNAYHLEVLTKSSFDSQYKKDENK